ncbi:hypothetical protein [Actinokineospora diospyrosa]|uniref:Uncharacterized protein n=1 Tax=Actinokineospora diospyrosa TaxID=103728 RepID=A0ABT1I580_9PSEU|nr:hypothetical protein [Actinokineospora diospyrosa]MCP2267726.1 hypothetical protein [Actinokineospora diospyrosa]
MSEPADQLSHRARAMLRAVAEGRGHLASGSEPDLYIDGVPCCDQFTAHLLTHDGLVTGPHGRFGELVPATLTAAGSAALGTAVLAA